MFFAKPGLSEFHESSVGKNHFLEPDFFATPGLSEFHESSAGKNSEREKLIFRSWNPRESQPFAAKARERMGRQNSLKARFL